MTDKVGKLGQSTVATPGSTNVYQCPAGKGAKCSVFFSGVAGAGSTLQVVVAGIITSSSGALTGGNVAFSTSLQQQNSAVGATINGSSDATTVAPGPKVYWLSAGDIISYNIGGAAFASMNFQVVGVEVDVV